MIEFKYCIKHEHEVILGLTGAPSNSHWIQDEDDVCYGPFTETPPPIAFEEDWDLNIVEPSDEELAVMDQGAESLLADILA